MKVLFVNISPPGSQEGLYREQLRLCQELQTESVRVQEQKTEVKGQLEAAQSSRQGLEEQLQRLQRENTQLQVCSGVFSKLKNAINKAYLFFCDP